MREANANESIVDDDGDVGLPPRGSRDASGKGGETNQLAIAISIISLLTSIVSGWANWRSAERTLQASDEDGRRAERAYVGIERAQLLDFQRGGGPIVSIEIANYGQTPALNVRTAYGVKIVPAGQEKTSVSDFKELKDTPLSITINKSTIKISDGRALPVEAFDKIAGGKFSYVLLTRIR